MYRAGSVLLETKMDESLVYAFKVFLLTFYRRFLYLILQLLGDPYQPTHVIASIIINYS